MFRIAHPRLAAVAVSLGTGLALLAVTPRIARLEGLDRTLFGFLSGKGRAVLGTGSVDDPRRVEEFESAASIPPAELLLLEEDAAGYFEDMPPPPADVAVVLARLHERGARGFGYGYPLQWEQADTLAVEAMRRVMDRFDAAVIGLPLKDSTAGDPVAAPFLRASVGTADLAGDASEIPVVNTIRGVAPELGGDRSLAGFTRLETEKPEQGRAYLLARWGDRVVFSLPLVLEAARRGVPVEEFRVVVGEEIRMGADGPRIPIDFRGRVDLPDDPPEPLRVAATAVISEELPEGFATGAGPLFVADGRLLGPKEDVAWGDRLPRVDAAVRRAPRRVGVRPVPRPDPVAELLALVGLALLAGFALGARLFELRVATAAAVTAGVGLLLMLLVRAAGVAPVPLAFLAVPVVGLVVGEIGRFTQRIEVVTVREAEGGPAAEAPSEGKKGRGRRRKRKR